MTAVTGMLALGGVYATVGWFVRYNGGVIFPPRQIFENEAIARNVALALGVAGFVSNWMRGAFD